MWCGCGEGGVVVESLMCCGRCGVVVVRFW